MCDKLILKLGLVWVVWFSNNCISAQSSSWDSVKLGQYDKCDPNNVGWCDYNKWLYCHKDGFCGCLHPHRQIFDDSRDRCVAIPGKECNVYLPDNCVKDSYCSFDRKSGNAICKCKSGYTQSGVSCELIPIFGATTSTTVSPFVQNLRKILITTPTTTPTTPWSSSSVDFATTVS